MAKKTGDVYKYYAFKSGPQKGKRYKIYGELRDCLSCGKEFFARYSAIKRGQSKFCSISCSKHPDHNPNFTGRIYDSYGYINVYQPNHPNKLNYGKGYVKEHRLVMEKHLGRYLDRHEIVHHINEIKDDNRIENLEISNLKEHSYNHIIDKYKELERDKLGRFRSKING